MRSKSKIPPLARQTVARQVPCDNRRTDQKRGEAEQAAPCPPPSTPLAPRLSSATCGVPSSKRFRPTSFPAASRAAANSSTASYWIRWSVLLGEKVVGGETQEKSGRRFALPRVQQGDAWRRLHMAGAMAGGGSVVRIVLALPRCANHSGIRTRAHGQHGSSGETRGAKGTPCVPHLKRNRDGHSGAKGPRHAPASASIPPLSPGRANRSRITALSATAMSGGRPVLTRAPLRLSSVSRPGQQSNTCAGDGSNRQAAGQRRGRRGGGGGCALAARGRGGVRQAGRRFARFPCRGPEAASRGQPCAPQQPAAVAQRHKLSAEGKIIRNDAATRGKGEEKERRKQQHRTHREEKGRHLEESAVAHDVEQHGPAAGHDDGGDVPAGGGEAAGGAWNESRCPCDGNGGCYIESDGEGAGQREEPFQAAFKCAREDLRHCRGDERLDETVQGWRADADDVVAEGTEHSRVLRHVLPAGRYAHGRRVQPLRIPTGPSIERRCVSSTRWSGRSSDESHSRQRTMCPSVPAAAHPPV